MILIQWLYKEFRLRIRWCLKHKDLIIMRAGNAGLSMCIVILISASFFIQVHATLIGEPGESVRNPFSPTAEPPEIVLINNNTQYMRT